MIVEFDPKDVVSIPKDCSYQKIRVCRYRVVEEFKGELPLFNGHVEVSDEPEEVEFWEIEEDDDGDDMITISTEELQSRIEDKVEEMKGEVVAQVRAEEEAKFAKRLRAIADSI